MQRNLFDLRWLTPEGCTRAAASGDLDYVTCYLKKYAHRKDMLNPRTDGLPALHYAAMNGHLAIVKQIVRAGGDIHRECVNRTALYYAVEKGHLPVVKYLLMNGAKVNHADMNGEMALHVAANDGHYHILKLLIAYGADVHATFKGEYAEERAARRGHHGSAKLLKTIRLSDAKSHQSFQERLEKIHVDDDIPAKYCDPITLRVMNDPIVTDCGRAYDRASLIAWFSREPFIYIGPHRVKKPLTDAETGMSINYGNVSKPTCVFIKQEIEAFVIEKEAVHAKQHARNRRKHSSVLFQAHDVTGDDAQRSSIKHADAGRINLMAN